MWLLKKSVIIKAVASTNPSIHSAVFHQRYFELLNMLEETHWGGSNRSSTKKNNLICVRAGQVYLEECWFSHHQQGLLQCSFNNLFTYLLYFLYCLLIASPLVGVLLFLSCPITIIASKSCHCPEGVCSAHLVIFSLIIPFLPLLPLSFHCLLLLLVFNPVCCFSF